MCTLDVILSALAHPVRRQAMRLLQEGTELCLCQFMSQLNIAQPNMSRHMSALKRAGLVTDRRDAQWVRYRRGTKVPPVLAAVVDAILAAPDAEAATLGRERAA